MNTLTKKLLVSAMILTIFISFLVQAGTVHLGGISLQSIEIQKNALYPEGIDYNPMTDRFVVGSFREGAVYEVDLDGNYHQIIKDDRLNSVLAVRVDIKRDRLFVANSDIGASIRSHSKGSAKLASVIIYELSTGKGIHYVDLGSLLPDTKHLANDIALDTEGNAYVTDSFSSVVYKIDTNGKGSVFLQNKRFSGEGINLNGIVFHPDGFLIAVKKGEGVLFKIPLNSPNNFSEIESSKKFIGGDGLILVNKKELVVIANRAAGQTTETVFSISSQDGWKTSKVNTTYKFDKVYPTTGVIKRNKIYVLHSNLNVLMSTSRGKQSQLQKKATIQQVGEIKPVTKAFVYTEVQNSVPFENVPWKSRNPVISSQSGFISKTWLSGHNNHSVGGIYSFDSIKNAKKYVTEFFPNAVKKQGFAHTSRIFDAVIVEEASRNVGSAHYGKNLSGTPGAFVYTELQVNIPFKNVPWQQRNPIIKKIPGLLSKTWLSGIDNNTIGGIYAFDTLENAKYFATEQFPKTAAKMNAALTTRIFDAIVVEEASRDMNSPFFQ